MAKNALKRSLYSQLSNAEVEEQVRRLHAYHAALGRFVAMFAKVEMGAHLVLRHYAKMSTAAGRALLSGVRVDETRGRLKRLFEVGLIDVSDWGDIEPALQQLGIINGCRNDILHHGAVAIADGEGFVTNAAMALTPERITAFPISPEILDDMTADLRKIIVHLHTRHMGRPPFAAQQPEVEAMLRAPWKYRPPASPPDESQKSGRRGRASNKAPPPPPPPSPG